MLKQLIHAIQTDRPTRITLNPADLLAVELALASDAGPAVYAPTESSKPAPMPTGATMMLLGVPVFTSHGVAAGSVRYG